MRVLSLLVRHGASHYKDAEQDLVHYFNTRLASVDWDLLIIDNSLPEGFVQKISDKHTLIGGSNDQWEFSSWDSGITYVRDSLDKYDFIHLVTSAFRALNSDHIDKIDIKQLQFCSGTSVALGHIDYYNQPIQIYNHTSQAWLRSSFIFLPPAVVKKLGSFVRVNEYRAFFSQDPQAPFLAEAPLSENFQQYILSWLTGEGTGQGVEWHSRFMLTADTLVFFMNKSMAILNEHLLSIRLQEEGCSMVDCTWLALRAEYNSKSLKHIPDWQLQIKQRNAGELVIKGDKTSLFKRVLEKLF